MAILHQWNMLLFPLQSLPFSLLIMTLQGSRLLRLPAMALPVTRLLRFAYNDMFAFSLIINLLWFLVVLPKAKATVALKLKREQWKKRAVIVSFLIFLSSFLCIKAKKGKASNLKRFVILQQARSCHVIPLFWLPQLRHTQWRIDGLLHLDDS